MDKEKNDRGASLHGCCCFSVLSLSRRTNNFFPTYLKPGLYKVDLGLLNDYWKKSLANLTVSLLYRCLHNREMRLVESKLSIALLFKCLEYALLHSHWNGEMKQYKKREIICFFLRVDSLFLNYIGCHLVRWLLTLHSKLQ